MSLTLFPYKSGFIVRDECSDKVAYSYFDEEQGGFLFVVHHDCLMNDNIMTPAHALRVAAALTMLSGHHFHLDVLNFKK